MATFTLNIYGENDAVIKTYETSHLRWRLFTEAVKTNEEIKDADPAEQLEVVGDFMRSVFVGLTAEEMELADANDILNNFQMIVKQAKKIGGGTGKN